MGGTALNITTPKMKVEQNASESPYTELGLPKQKLSEERGKNYSLSKEADLVVPINRGYSIPGTPIP